jgi:hypothetical protein
MIAREKPSRQSIVPLKIQQRRHFYGYRKDV